MMEGKESTRSRSKKQESRIAKELRGMVTINSGATFGQNDVITDFCEVEAKTTKNKSYSLSTADWRKLKKKCAADKIPVMVIDFEEYGNSLAVLPYADLKYLIECANRKD